MTARRAELVDHERYPTRAAAVASIGEYIDEFHNLVRRRSHLKYISPIELELRRQSAVLAARSDRPRNRGTISSSASQMVDP